MADREQLKQELIEIAEVLERFPASVQPKVFDILAAHLPIGADTARKPAIRAAPKGTAAGERSAAGMAGEGKKRPRSAEGNLGIVKELDLRAKDGVPSWAEFVAAKEPTSNIAFNTLAVYFLRQLRGMDGISPDHVYTCYKDVKRRPPSTAQALRQSLWDASSSRYGYLDTSNMSDIKIPQRGINFVEHDLPAPAKPRRAK